MRKSSTLADVANLAGVSLSTVSRILQSRDGKAPFSAATQKKVREAAELLDYRPSRLARSLVSAETGVVGMVIPAIGDSFAGGIVEGAQAELSATGKSLMLANSMNSPEIEQSGIAELISWRVDGLVILPTQTTDDMAPLWDLWNRGFPFVLVDRTYVNSPFYTVTTDDYAGAVCAVEHLISRGRRRIALATRSALVWTNRLRREAYASTLLAHGMTPSPSLIVETSPSMDGGREVVSRLFAAPEPPDAIFCCTDLVAVGVIDECARRGIRVPDDLAVVGYSDLDYSAFLRVPLTTVRQPARAMGAEAVRLLASIVAGDKPQEPNRMLPVELVVRDST